MAKVISGEELARMRELGVSIERETRNVSVEGLAALVNEFKRIADAHEAMLEKRNEELLQAINGLTKAVANKVVSVPDLGPILRELVALQKTQLAPSPRPSYVFDITRNSRGLLTSVRARPAEETKH